MNKVKAPRFWAQSELAEMYASLDHPWNKLLGKLYSDFIYSTNLFYKEKGYYNTLMPVTCSSISSPMGRDSDSLPVFIKLFGQETYLTDSMQFLLEYNLRLNTDTDGVQYVMPSFRGEEPDNRHLNQFFHSEAEIKGGLEDVMRLVEEYVIFLAKALVPMTVEAVEVRAQRSNVLKKVISPGFTIPRITNVEAFEILKTTKGTIDIDNGIRSISPKGEAILIHEFGGIVWLTHPEHLSVPFYQQFSTDETYAEAADLLMGIGEVVGCGARHVNRHECERALKLHEVSTDEYEWYLHMKQIKPMQTAGFGLGVERFLLWVMDHNDIRDRHIFSRLKGIVSVP